MKSLLCAYMNEGPWIAQGWFETERAVSSIDELWGSFRAGSGVRAPGFFDAPSDAS
jgi:hypothetical protein